MILTLLAVQNLADFNDIIKYCIHTLQRKIYYSYTVLTTNLCIKSTLSHMLWNTNRIQITSLPKNI